MIITIDDTNIFKFENKIEEFLFESYGINFNLDFKTRYRIVKEKIKELKKYLVNNTAFVFGKIESDNLVGMIWCFEYMYFDEKRMHINQIIVEREFRGTGISKELLSYVEKFTKNRGIKVIDLNVTLTNKTATRLYKDNGFVTSREYLTKKL